MASLPPDCTAAGVQPVLPPVPRIADLKATDKPVVLLTSVRIPDAQLWANGLFANVFMLYRMMENLGMTPWLLVDSMNGGVSGELTRTFRQIDVNGFASAPFRVFAYVELAMSCDPAIRRFFKALGAKTIKTYLGNILNIDVETPIFYSSMNFSHHVAGELDEIWVSPHYEQHAEYAGAINGMDPSAVKVAPYVWDPMFIKDAGGPGVTEVYVPPPQGSGGVTAPRAFVVMCPNISHQKCSWVSIMAIEAYYRRHPERVDAAVIINGKKLGEVPFVVQTLLPRLRLYRDGKLHLLPRAETQHVARTLRSAVVVQHQVNNEYNYSFLEWMTMGFPVVHNAPTLGGYGYGFAGADIDGAADAIEKAVAVHDANRETYRTQARQLAWRFSIHNPDNLATWRRMLGGAGAPP